MDHTCQCHEPGTENFMLKKSWIKIFSVLLACLLIFTLCQKKITLLDGFQVAPPPPSFIHKDAPYFHQLTLVNQEKYNHASSVVMQADAQALIAWAGGKKELDPGLHIYFAKINIHNQLQGSTLFPVFNKYSVEHDEQRYMHGIANPVLVEYDHKLWLFFASTFGGWSTASLNYKTSIDGGATWSPAKILILSPFINFSHGLKTQPILFKDGTLGLPVYSEFARYQAKLLRINPRGDILSLQNLSWHAHEIQPMVVPLTNEIAPVFIREHGGMIRKIFSNKSIDGGQTFDYFGPSRIANPDAAISATAIDQENILLAFNDSPFDEERKNFKFAIVNYFKDTICILPFDAFSHKIMAYPYLIRYKDTYLMSYSDGANISLFEFNQAWLNTQWKICTPI
jgi:predicted neuraminidase